MECCDKCKSKVESVATISIIRDTFWHTLTPMKRMHLCEKHLKQIEMKDKE